MLYFAVDEIKWLCAFTQRTTQKLVTKRQSTPFDIKYKKLSLMQKTSGNVFLGHLGK